MDRLFFNQHLKKCVTRWPESKALTDKVSSIYSCYCECNECIVKTRERLLSKCKASASTLFLIFNLVTYLLAQPIVAIYNLITGTIKSFAWKRKKSLKNENILVIGGSKGIGREICLRIGKLERNCTIICWDIDIIRANSLVAELKTLGVKKAFAFQVDVRDREIIRKTAEHIRSRYGEVTALFDCVGESCSPKPFWKHTESDVEAVFKCNLLAHLWILQEFLPSMILSDRGSVVLVSSILAVLHANQASTYTAAAHAISTCIASLRRDLQGVTEAPNVHLLVAYTASKASPIMRELRSSMKYPFLLPRVKYEKVAQEVVDGMLDGREVIFIPAYSRLASFLPEYGH